MAQLPNGFTAETMEGNIVCPHRDLSVCPTCADAHDEIVEVVGLHFWITDPAERAELLTAIGA